MKSQNVGLPVRPRPFVGEALTGYLIRVSETNGHPSPARMSGAIKKTYGGGAFTTLYKWLRLTDAEKSLLIGPVTGAWRDTAAPLPDSEFNYRYMRWCPTCLKNNAYLKGDWAAKLCCVCDQHKCFLYDSCSVCGELQSLERKTLLFCKCGAELSNAPLIPADKFVLKINRLLGYGNRDPAQPVSSRINLDPLKMRRLVRYIGQIEDGILAKRPGKICGLDQITVVQKIVVNAALLLQNWPTNFERVLAAAHANAGRGNSIRRVFGRLYYMLYVDLKDPCFQFLREAFERYIVDHWDGSVCNRNRLLAKQTIVAHPYISLRKAARIATVKFATARHLVKTGNLNVRTIEMQSGRKAQLLHADDIATMRMLGTENLSFSEACEHLGLSKKRLKELIDSGLIKPIGSRIAAGASAWTIPRHELDALQPKKRPYAGSKETVSLDHVAKYWRLRDGEFVGLVRAMAEGRLDCRQSSATAVLGQTLMLTSKLRDWLESLRAQSEHLTIDQAAKMLGIKQQVGYELTYLGLLKTILTKSGKRTSQTAIDAFRSNYISLADLARVKGRSPRAVLKTIAASPICGPSVDGSRQYFFKVRDIKRCSDL